MCNQLPFCKSKTFGRLSTSTQDAHIPMESIAAPESFCPLLDLPPEILFVILGNLDVLDIMALRQVCEAASQDHSHLDVQLKHSRHVARSSKSATNELSG